ncbi:Zinc finger MYM-type protein 3 [Armadillidium vulgare]|nr:Zinc finger MYM-type protein 3 [Armadillidium vulgare]
MQSSLMESKGLPSSNISNRTNFPTFIFQEHMKLLHSCRMMRSKKTQGLGFNGIFFEKEGLLFPCPLQMLFILVLYSSTYPKIILKAVLCICDDCFVSIVSATFSHLSLHSLLRLDVSDELCLFNIIICFIFIMAINCCGCNKKLTRLNKNNLEFVTKLYCSLECLKSFCFEHLQRCCHCNVLVEDKARIKYCTRFGTKVEQFCSQACLENYKKLNTFCTLCKQKLGVMVISKEKKFCSLFCASRFNGRGINQKFFENRNMCSVCKTVGVHHYEILKGSLSEFVCSKNCLKAYNWMCPEESDTVRASCSLCGCKLLKCKVNFFLGGWIIGFCSEQCSSIYLTINSEILMCGVCNIKKLNFDLIRRSGKKSDYFCSVPCLTERLNEEEKQDHFDGPHSELLGSRLRKNHLRSSTDSCIEVERTIRYKREHVKKFLEKWAGNTEEKGIQTNKWEGYFYQKINSATQCFNSLQTSSSQTDDTLGSKGTGVDISNLIFTPFPVHVPTPVGMDAQFQIIPIFSPVPVPIPLPLLKRKNTKADLYTNDKEGNASSIVEGKAEKDEANPRSNIVEEEAVKDDNPFSKKIIEERVEIDDSSFSSLIIEEERVKDDFSYSSSIIEEKSGKKDASSSNSKIEEEKSKCDEEEKSKCDDASVKDNKMEKKLEKDDNFFRDNIIEDKLLKIDEDSGDQFSLLNIDIPNTWSPDSDIFEIDLSPHEPEKTVFRSKNSYSETSVKSSETQDAKLLNRLFSECKISRNTKEIRESVGKKVWEEFVTEKSKDEEFMSKVSSRIWNINDISKMDRCFWVMEFISSVQKYFTSHSVFDSIFTCVSYQKASNLFFQFLQKYLDTFSSVTSLIEFRRT